MYFLEINIILSIILFLSGIFIFYYVLRKGLNNNKVQQVLNAINISLNSFLKSMYIIKLLASIVIFVFIIAKFNLPAGVVFLLGLGLTSLLSYVCLRLPSLGLERAMDSNRKTFQDSAEAVLKTCVLTVITLAFFIVVVTTAYYYNFMYWRHNFAILMLGMTMNLIFYFLPGSIFAKAADIGTDLVGKVEAGIPEDDPRNPATILDNVGEHLLYAGRITVLVTTCIISIFAAEYFAMNHFTGGFFRGLPTSIAIICIMSATLWCAFIKFGENNNLIALLNKSLVKSILLSVVLVYTYIEYIYALGTEIFPPPPFKPLKVSSVFNCVISGFIALLLMTLSANFFSSRFSQAIAQSSVTGHATNIIQGLIVYFKASIIPIIILSLSMLVAYLNCGMFGVALSAVTILSCISVFIMFETFCLISMQFNSIIEMSGMLKGKAALYKSLELKESQRNNSLGVHTVIAGSMGALILFCIYGAQAKSYINSLEVDFHSLSLDAIPFLTISLLFGGMLPNLLNALNLKFINRAAIYVITEARRQFKEIAGLIHGHGKVEPDYTRAANILTKTSCKCMVMSMFMTILAPIIFYAAIKAFTSPEIALYSLGALLFGIFSSSISQSISMMISGNAWDQAKKYIEDGNFGGKGSEAHKAAVTGDTVGDPFKDTLALSLPIIAKISVLTGLIILFYFP
jgi:K(+)-stimulated pyrophosphate-energized sodium pump